MGCGCNDPIMSWYDLENHVPKNPFDIIDYLDFGGQEGVFERSSNYIGSGFVTTPLSYTGVYAVEAWETDNQQKVGDARMWTQQHKVVNVDPSVPAELQKMAFPRSGREWRTMLEVNVAVDLDWLEFSFLENAGTRGDAQGTVPVIKIENPIINGIHPLVVTLKHPGTVSIGVRAQATGSGDQSLWDTDWVIV